jgi:16S rRNA (guanine527-N7)-methyltransferase
MQNNKNHIDDDEAIRIPINGVLDLHTFHPKELSDLVRDYLDACLEAGIHSVRIIHGKGKGLQKNRVCSLLEKLPVVESYVDAGPGAGGWGATQVELKREMDVDSPAWANLLKSGAESLGVSLGETEIAQFVVHARELLEWNRRTNLTAIKAPGALAVKQFLDTLPLAPLPPVKSRLLDMGSGGGFPGIPLKILRPDLHVTLIDSSRKKVSFQKHVIRTLGLKNVEAHHIRAEELSSDIHDEEGLYDVVVSKALSDLTRFSNLALPLLRRPGMLIAMKGPSAEVEIEEAEGHIQAEGLTISVQEYTLPYLNVQRCLVVLSDRGEVI